MKDLQHAHCQAMFNYPKLSLTEQAGLPRLIAPPTAMPSKFEDSTHQLWHCQTVQGEMVLKVCNQQNITQSTFWLGLNHLFGADFPNSLANIANTHEFLTQHGTLQVPEFVASKDNQFVLTRFIKGKDLTASHLDESSIIALAKHIVHLHMQSDTHWGDLHAPQFSAEYWTYRLKQTLSLLAEKSTIPIDKAWLNVVLEQASKIKETRFVPMMLDLRWDQLRYCDNDALVLIDLDAFVIAPKSLDLVLIANLMTEAQLALFKQHYENYQAWPDYTQQKPCYQLLLFLMKVFGETNLASWMKRI